jgi:hypothetical protein
MPGVSVSSPALGNTISAEWEIAFLQNRKVRRPASCKIVLAGFFKVHPRRQLDRLVFTFPVIRRSPLGKHLPDQAYGFCHAVTAFKGGKQLADAQPLMQTIILGPQNKDYCFVPIITF